MELNSHEHPRGVCLTHWSGHYGEEAAILRSCPCRGETDRQTKGCWAAGCSSWPTSTQKFGSTGHLSQRFTLASTRQSCYGSKVAAFAPGSCLHSRQEGKRTRIVSCTCLSGKPTGFPETSTHSSCSSSVRTRPHDSPGCHISPGADPVNKIKIQLGKQDRNWQSIQLSACLIQ